MNAKEQNMSMPDVRYVVKKRDILSIIFSIAIFLGGVVAFVYHDRMIGSILIFISILFFWLKSWKKIYIKSGSTVRSFTYFMDSNNAVKLDVVLKSRDIAKEEPVIFSRIRDARMDIVISNDKRYAAVQLFVIEDSVWVEHSKTSYFFDSDAEILISYIDSCKIE